MQSACGSSRPRGPTYPRNTLWACQVSISGDGAVSYTDVNYSTLTAATTALYIASNGDVRVETTTQEAHEPVKH